MATPMFRDLSRALEAPEEGRELWSGIPADEEPAYAEEMFRKASDAALARENALPKTGYVPAGVGPAVEPSMESPLAPLPSGLRSRKPVEFTPDTAKMQGKLSGFLGGNQLLRGPEYGRPLSDEEFASEQERARKLMAQDNASFARDIPVASAEGSKTLASTVPGSGGDDELGRLSMGQALVRALEGSGSVISGQNLRSGAADTLGDRMKQIEALRAKREEQSLEQQRERSTWGASNRATLASALAQWKDDPEKKAALEALASGADTTKPGDFSRNTVNAVMTRPKVLGAEAGVGKTLVQIPDIQAGTAGKVAKTAEIGPEGESKRKLRAAQVAKIYKDMELAGTKLAIDERKTIEQAQQSKDPYKKLESLNTIADKKEFGGFTTLAGDLGDLERVAPGFVTRGEVPEWLTREQQLLGQNWPTSTDPRVVDFLAAYGKVANEERHRQYGSAQTDGELRAFMQQLNANPLSAGPQVLAQQVKRFGQAAGRVAKGRLTRYNNVFGAENVDTVFAPEWKPLFDAGGVFASQGTPFASPVRAEAEGAPTPTPAGATVRIQRKAGGPIRSVPAADKARYLANPDFVEVP